MKRVNQVLQYQPGEFSVLNKSAMWLGNVALIFITPFAINNLINGRLDVAIASLFIVSIFAFNTFSILVWNKYYSNIALFILSPAILLFCYYSIPTQGIIGVLWSFPAIVCLYYLLPEYQARIINLLTLSLCTYLAFKKFDPKLAARIFATLSLISAFTAVSIRQINKQQIALHQAAITDSLTGLFNRNTINSVLNNIIEIHHKLSKNCHLLTLDVDHFKSINDQYGHDQGDEVLKEIASTIEKTVNDNGVVFRCGGEEFMIVIEEMSWEKIKRLAENIRLDVENTEFLNDINVTISIGISKLKPSMSRIDWIRESDRNLYTAKAQGRNQVISS